MAESKVKRENYLVIQGWMITDLKLKGNELLIYACIYGFSQNDQRFNGTLQYLADWTNGTTRGVIKNLQSLEEKGLIDKKVIYVNKVKRCEYRTTDLRSSEQSSQGVVNKVHGGSEQSSQGVVNKVHGGSEQSSHNNIDNNIVNNSSDICVYEKIKIMYTSICKSLHTLKAITAKRKEAIDKILSIYSIDQLEEIFKKAEASEYCKGSREGWKAGFDWLMNEDNIAKLLEGNYDTMRNPKSQRKEVVPSWMIKETSPTYDNMADFEERLLANGTGSDLTERVEKLKERLKA